MLTVNGLTKSYTKKNEQTGETRQVGIFDLTFSAKPGVIFGLIGANGAGKTTTMRMVAGLTQPHSGVISLADKPYSKIANIKQKVALVSGETNVFDRTTPREILTMFGQASGVEKAELKQKISELSEKLQMQDFLDERTNNFSTGMKQKTSIARALVTEPEILIFDEITNGLDIFASQSVKQIVQDLAAEGKIVLYSTHIMPDADELCEELAIVHKGHLVTSGTKAELLAKYKQQNVKDLFFNLVTHEQA